MIRELAVLCAFALAHYAAAQGINGQVTEDHSGSPLASVEIRVQRIGVTRLIADVETDPNGEFRLPQLPAGDYRFDFSKTNYVDTTVQFKASIPPSIAVRLVRCGVISGKLFDQQGGPVRGAVVYAMPKPAGNGPLRPMVNQGEGSYALTNPDGEYRLFYLQPGDYVVAASYGASSMVLGMTGSAPVNPVVGTGVMLYPDSARPQFLTIAGGEDYGGIDFHLPPASLFSVSGKVDPLPQDAGKGAFWLTLASVDLPSVAAAAATTDAQGAFHFDGVAAGAYYLLASGPSSARGQRGAVLPSEPYFARSRVTVVARNVEGLVVSPQKGGAAAFAMAAPPEAKGACPESAELTLTSMEDWSANLDRTATLSTKAQPLANLAPARYAARLENLGDLCYQAADAILDMTSGEAQPLAIQVSAAGAIRGQLTGAERPGDFVVALLAADPMSGERAVLAAAPDPQGRFSFEGLRPGAYYVAAQPAGASRSRWIADPAHMLQIEIRGGSRMDLQLPVAAASEGGGR
jgi:protocatechuate 3,4-dioxygenase beta subunit